MGLCTTGQTEAVGQQLQLYSAVVPAGLATFDQGQTISFYFYFHNWLAGRDGILFSQQCKALIVSGTLIATILGCLTNIK